MIKKFLTSLVLLIPFYAFAQPNFQQAYVVNALGGGINGYIGDKEISAGSTGDNNPTTRFFIGAGLTRSKANYTGDHLLAEDGTEVKKSDFPFLNLGMDLFANPATKRLIYRLELSFLGGSYKSESGWKDDGTRIGDFPEQTKLEHAFNQYTAQLTPQLIFNIYNSNKFKYFVSGGASLNFSVYRKNENIKDRSSFNAWPIPIYTANPIDFKSFYFSPRINTGIVLNNKLEVVAGYQPRSAITTYSDYTVGVQRLSLGINFLFGNH